MFIIICVLISFLLLFSASAFASTDDILIGTFYHSDSKPENYIMASKGTESMRKISTLYSGGFASDRSGSIHPGHVDPSITYHDGLWWTISAWNRADGKFWPVFSYSSDLVHWSYPEGDQLLKGTHGIGLDFWPSGFSSTNKRFDVVAPELFEDKDGVLWIVFSAGFFGNFHAGYNSLNDNMCAYYVRVKTLSANPEGYADTGGDSHMFWPKNLCFEVDGVAQRINIPNNSGKSSNLIDGSFVTFGNATYLFIKRDGLNNQVYVTTDLSQNAWRMVCSSCLYGWEGVSCVRFDSRWLLVADQVSGFTAIGTRLFVSNSLTSGLWQSALSQPTTGMRHGSLYVARKGTNAWKSAYEALRTSIGKANILPIGDKEHTGKQIRPIPSVSVGGKNLVCGQDFRCSYKKNICAGIATITITGVGDYKGTRRVTFRIVPRKIRQGDVTLSKCIMTFTGKELQPALKFRYGSWVDDVSVTWSKNIHAGTAFAKVTGKGDLKGTITLRFVIQSVSLKSVSISSLKARTWTGSAIRSVPKVIYKGIALVRGRDFVCEYSNNTNVGRATVKINGKGDFSGSVIRSYEIRRVDISKCLVSVADIRWTGTACKFLPKVSFNGIFLKRGVDYDVSWSNNSRPGTAYVIVRGKRNISGTVKKSFTILPAMFFDDNVKVLSNARIFSPAGVVPDIVVTIGSVQMRSGIDFVLSRLSKPIIGDNEVTIIGTNWLSWSRKVHVNVMRRSLASDGVSISLIDSVLYTGSAVYPKPVVQCDNYKLVKNVDYKLSWSNNIDTGVGTITIQGIGKYCGKVQCSFAILSDTSVV